MPEDASWSVPAAVRAKLRPRNADEGWISDRCANRSSIGRRRTGLRGRSRMAEIILDDPERGHVRRPRSLHLQKDHRHRTSNIYGFGDKTGPFNRRGASYVNWTTDAWGFDRGTDPIYKSIPVLHCDRSGTGGAYGLFLDNTLAKLVRFRPSRRKHARNLGGWRTDRLLHHRRPDRRRCRPPLHRPDWQGAAAAALGTGLPAVALQLHERRPRSATLPSGCARTASRPTSSGSTSTSRTATVRSRPTRQTFPDLKGLARDVGKARVSSWSRSPTCTSRCARTKVTLPTTAGSRATTSSRTSDGSLYVAPVWPGPSVFPDFTRKASRDWWGSAVQDVRRRRHRRLLERHERAGHLRHADQDHAADHDASDRRRRLHVPPGLRIPKSTMSTEWRIAGRPMRAC